jgi:hypothetical protein
MGKKPRLTGASTRKRPKGQPKVAELNSNAAIIALPVNPARAKAKGNQVEMIPAGSVGEVVRRTGAPKAEFSVKVTARGTKSDADPVAKSAAMEYGADDPENVLTDFLADSLISKVKLATPAVNADQIAQRPLLDQRLEFLAVDEFLTNSRVKALLEEPGGAKRLLEAIQAEIGRVEDLAVVVRQRTNVKEASK